ncbi:MAG: GNAT family protein [Pseudomonadales bacterium]
MTLVIDRVDANDLQLLAEHQARHRAESGQDGFHFMPFAPGDDSGPRLRLAEGLERPLTEPGWERVFAAFTDHRAGIVGEVNLTGDSLRTGLHRCELGIGIEHSHRGQGLGRRLMQTAIDFVRAAEPLAWLDLKVFAHNHPARALYRTLGFQEIGTVTDRFRIDGARIDDVMMTLDVRG